MLVYFGYIGSTVASGTIAPPVVGGLVGQLVRALADSLRVLEMTSRAAAPVAVDVEDIQKSRQGDSEAYRRLVERHQAHVGRVLWRFTRDRAVHEELVQDAFVEAYLGLGTYHQKAPFANWLSRIATRVGYRYWKQTARQARQIGCRVENLSLEEWDRIPHPDKEAGHLDPDQAAELLHRLLQQLPPRDRLVLTLRYFEDCDIAQIAGRTGWTKTMVKVQSLRARRKLRKLLEQSNKEPAE